MAWYPFLLFLAASSNAPFRAYVADLDAGSVTLAWGRANGGAGENTIGYGAKGSGRVSIRVAGRTIESDRAWVKIEGLQPDTAYPYTIAQNGATLAKGSVRTWPTKSDELTFFVIGDFGNGKRAQIDLARRMEEERLRLEKSGVAVRFVLSMGDNVYGKVSASGAKDRDWEDKFFAPYAATLAAVPFKAVLGNHDGDESERAADLAVCLDNFFMPGRWYGFTYAGFAEFVALDSTRNRDGKIQGPAYLPDGEQSQWLREALSKPGPAWRMAIMHHPMFTAGPNHKPALNETRHWFEMFKQAGIQIVFSGHEHNLQISERNAATGNIQFVLSGAGGELRKDDVRKNMTREHVRAWSNANHFLIVRIQETTATIQPAGVQPLQLREADGKLADRPVTVARRQDR